MTRTLLCYGDSNTYGTPPLTSLLDPHRRYDAATRWPTRTREILGPDWALVEEGLPGRTTQFADTIMGEHMDGRLGLKIALQSHGPIDALAIMLGTNDTKAMFGATPQQITAGIAALLSIALDDTMQARHGGFRVLLICPAPVEEAGCLAGIFYGGRAKALALPPLYRDLAAARGVGFLDAGEVMTVSPVDGVHFAPGDHAALAAAVAAAVRAL
jgi:lysophospholipase L1-like esterase